MKEIQGGEGEEQAVQNKRARFGHSHFRASMPTNVRPQKQKSPRGRCHVQHHVTFENGRRKQNVRHQKKKTKQDSDITATVKLNLYKKMGGEEM